MLVARALRRAARGDRPAPWSTGPKLLADEPTGTWTPDVGQIIMRLLDRQGDHGRRWRDHDYEIVDQMQNASSSSRARSCAHQGPRRVYGFGISPGENCVSISVGDRRSTKISSKLMMTVSVILVVLEKQPAVWGLVTAAEPDLTS